MNTFSTMLRFKIEEKLEKAVVLEKMLEELDDIEKSLASEAEIEEITREESR